MARGSIRQVQRKAKDGTQYTAWRARVPGGIGADGKRRQLSKVCRTKGEAQKWVAERIAEGARAPERMTVAELLDRWTRLHARHVEGATVRVDRWAAKAITRDLGTVEVSKLGVLRLQAWYEGLEARYAPGSIGLIHRVLRGALDQAVAWEVIARNPAIGTRRPPPKPETRTEPWGPDHVGVFLAETRDDLDGPLWALLLATGIRIGEALALDWGHVSADGATLTVARTMTRDADNRPVMGERAKTDSSRRRIALPLLAQAALARQRRAQDRRRADRGDGWTEDGAVFDRGDGVRRTDWGARQALHARVRALKLPAMTPHGLRHTCATLLARRGVSPHRIKELLGHGTIKTTMDTYAHVLESDKADTAAEMDRALGYEIIGQDGSNVTRDDHAG